MNYELFSASFRYALEYENSFHAKFQCKLRKPKKFRQTFFDACHAGLLCKVKRDLASVPFESRILFASIEDHETLTTADAAMLFFGF